MPNFSIDPCLIFSFINLIEIKFEVIKVFDGVCYMKLLKTLCINVRILFWIKLAHWYIGPSSVFYFLLFTNLNI